MGIKGQHPGLNNWLYLKQHGLDADNGDVTLQVVPRESSLWEPVRDGTVDAALVTPPADVFARRAGLKVIDIDFLPMIFFTTFSTGLSFVQRHPDIVERFLKGVIEGTAYFKTHREEVVKILQEKYQLEGELDTEAATHLYEELAQLLEAKPYPRMKAIANVYEEALRQDKAAEQVDPLQLWDLHYLRSIDDSGFIDALYQ